MRGTKNGSTGARLEVVCRQFERWRRRKQGHPRIPESLWREAVRLAPQYSVHRIARALGLNHSDLKRRVEGRRAGGRRRPAPRLPTFVEVDLGGSTGSTECVVELEDSSGAKMRIELKGAAVDLAALSRSFWEGEA